MTEILLMSSWGRMAAAQTFSTTLLIDRDGIRIRVDGSVADLKRIVTWREIEAAPIDLIAHHIEKMNAEVMEIVRRHESPVARAVHSGLLIGYDGEPTNLPVTKAISHLIGVAEERGSARASLPEEPNMLEVGAGPVPDSAVAYSHVTFHYVPVSLGRRRLAGGLRFADKESQERYAAWWEKVRD